MKFSRVACQTSAPARVVPCGGSVQGPGGRFITQQCGGTNHTELNDLIGIPRPPYEAWCLEKAAAQLRTVGFEAVTGREQFTTTRFHDVGAIVYYIRVVPWQAPDFRATNYLEPLRAMHHRIETAGPLTIRAHHFLVEAVRPDRDAPGTTLD
jgi:hypothetical protein